MLEGEFCNAAARSREQQGGVASAKARKPPLPQCPSAPHATHVYGTQSTHMNQETIRARHKQRRQLGNSKARRNGGRLPSAGYKKGARRWWYNSPTQVQQVEGMKGR